MLRNDNYHYNIQNECFNLHQMAVAGDVLEDFVIIFRDMMNRVCKTNFLYN